MSCGVMEQQGGAKCSWGIAWWSSLMSCGVKVWYSKVPMRLAL